MHNKSMVKKFRDFRWESVDVKEYKPEGPHFKDVTRQTVLGEGQGEGDLNFITRYFEIQPGGYSTLEKHGYPHSVIVVRGKGRVILGDQASDIEPFDCVYVSPETPHQFQAMENEPLGFLCIVDRVRDGPELSGDSDPKAPEAGT